MGTPIVPTLRSTPRPVLTKALLLAACYTGTAIAADNDPVPKVETVHVYGEQGETDTATKLNLTLFETPQTVTAISRVQMNDFNLNTITDVLDYTPGVTAERVETNRTYYTARGFDIVNFQYDGVGTPFTFGLNNGQQDTAIYEKIEVVKGAAGLITGLANPSATINYIRKRPTDDLQIGTRLSLNEWDGVRLDGDISGRLSDRVRGRLVAAKGQTESHLDRNETDTSVLYGIIDIDLTENTLLTLGHSYNRNDADGVLWGALPLLYSDGSRTDYDVSTSNAPDWTYVDNTENQTFVELKHALNANWTVNALYTRKDLEFDSALFYVFGTPDRTDETGLTGQASAYNSDEVHHIYDVFVSGAFELGGREHQLVVGYNYADIQTNQASYSPAGGALFPLDGNWAQGNTARPAFTDHTPGTDSTDIKQTHKSLYASSRLNLSDRLSVLLGARRAELSQKGINYGATADTDADKTVPYYGATYRLADDLMLYGSYSEVFKQQTWVNDQYEPLGATEGENHELGIKKSFNNQRAVLTIALFKSANNNLGEFVGRDASTGTAFYAPRDFDSKGYEVELSGELVRGLNVGAGFTYVKLEDGDGEEVRPYVPARLLKASASYRLPSLPKLKVGGIVKWQEEISTAGDTVEQKAYTLVDLSLGYDLSPKVSVALNVDNVTDEKYLNSLYWDQAYYGAPRNVSASISWSY